ncbi:MAG TPA: 30S ribosome-binding factor RbfA [Alphaproteobacteria bacterium]|nr:30S ribosome-binding factor RbfA [Alphaproteobacteria bacterium]
MSRQRFKPQSQRQKRVGEALRAALARILERAPFRDPDLQSVAATVTEVRASPDLRHATVYVVPFGGGDAVALAKALKRAAPFLRGLLRDEIELRYLPELVFEADLAFERAAELDRLLSSPAVVRDLAPAKIAPAEDEDEALDEDDDGA